MLVWLACSCGSPNTPSSLSEPAAGTIPVPTASPTTVPVATPTDALPATTLIVVPTRDDALLASVMPTQVTEPCPASSDPAQDAWKIDQMMAESTRLEPMLGQVLAYGGQHADEFGSYGLIWQSDGDASVFVSFTSHLDEHRDALRQVVAYPDELIVCQVAVSGDVARALMAKLADDLRGRYLSVAIGMGPVEVVLNPGEQTLADQLVEQYGDAVQVSICPNVTSCTLVPVARG